MELVERSRKKKWHVLGLPNEVGEEALLKSSSVRCTVPWKSQWNAKKILQDCFRENPHDQEGQRFLDTGQEQLICCWVAWVCGSGIHMNPGTIKYDVPEKVLHKMHLTTFI